MFNIIDQEKIFSLLKNIPEKKQVLEIINKAAEMKGLSLEDLAVLVNVEDRELIEEIFKTAQKIKLSIYGKRLVLFAPLYISSYCINDCAYCGFHSSNKNERKKLRLQEVKEEVEILERMGHKRLLLEFGEDPIHNPIDYVVKIIETIYNVKTGKGEIRRVNVNIAATTVENYKELKKAGIGTYQSFQETYHLPTYLKLHRGPKADYIRQITAMDRAFQGGLDDLGIGVLFGLYNWKFEILSLLSHAKYLEKKYGVGPHTISVPRFMVAPTVDYSPAYQVSDEDFLKLIALLRLAVPYTGMIISTRESPEIREKSFKIGISQTSAGSCTSVGGYKRRDQCSQFNLSDHRSLDEVIYHICQLGYLPSYCTACYRLGRTGDDFMKYAKKGEIHNFCLPNALLTFKEYLLDYASIKTREIGEKLIQKESLNIKDEKIRKRFFEKIKEIEEEKRDLYF